MCSCNKKIDLARGSFLFEIVTIMCVSPELMTRQTAEYYYKLYK